jgi:DNA invertase Pin-like site-specific DNA recombinase
MILENLKNTAFLYIRTSTTDQENSIELQQKLLDEYCSNRNITIIGKFIDFGKSAKDSDRPEFIRMMSLIKDSDDYDPIVGFVICTKLDRFARSLTDLVNNLNIIVEKKSIKFATVDTAIDASTPQGMFVLQLLGVVAEFERKLIWDRTTAGYKAAKDQGKLCNRPRVDVNKKRVLERLAKGLSATAVAKMEGTTASTIKSRLNEWGYAYINNKWVQRSDTYGDRPEHIKIKDKWVKNVELEKEE